MVVDFVRRSTVLNRCCQTKRLLGREERAVQGRMADIGDGSGTCGAGPSCSQTGDFSFWRVTMKEKVRVDRRAMIDGRTRYCDVFDDQLQGNNHSARPFDRPLRLCRRRGASVPNKKLRRFPFTRLSSLDAGQEKKTTRQQEKKRKTRNNRQADVDLTYTPRKQQARGSPEISLFVCGSPCRLTIPTLVASEETLSWPCALVQRKMQRT